MLNELSRTELLIGTNAIQTLKNAHVAVFGVGGVGGFTVEALARSGVGCFTLIDNDTVSITNINRQIIALQSTIGMLKVDIMKKRILDINPNAIIHINNCFYTKDNADDFLYGQFSYIVDAIDTVSSKILLAVKAYEFNIPIISSMGAGAKINPTMFEVSDIYKTSVCPLAKVLRKQLKALNIPKLKVVYSKENPIKNTIISAELKHTNRPVVGSISFTPSTAGLIIASEVIKDLTGISNL